MKAFIEISKRVRAAYQKQLPFIYAMCKDVVIDDIKKGLDKYTLFCQQQNKV